MSGKLETLLRQAQEHETGGIVLGLARVQQLLKALGNPQQNLQIIHIAGTNGKGSVAAFLDAILRQAGVRVGLYTSPHLIRFNERIQIDSEQISNSELCQILERVLQICRQEKIPATFFEITTAVALCYFSYQGLAADSKNPGIVILETGLGGRLDATNCVSPLLCLITAIGHDHEDFLGNTVAQISKEKAGILKQDTPAAAAPDSVEAATIIQQHAKTIGCNIDFLGEEFFFNKDLQANNSWQFHDQYGTIQLTKPGLAGDHQYSNCALAIAGIRILSRLGWNIPEQAIQQGVGAVVWPGRLQWIHNSTHPILIDGAHNIHAATILVNYLNSITDKPDRFSLIFAALKNKNCHAIAKILAPLVDRVWTISVGGERGMEASLLANIWRNLGKEATPCTTAIAALEMAREHSKPNQIILVAGSLYLVGEVQSLL
ncbi:MAG: bifunctional folylpolyglutamate synthase/dihydrofolate synthase [Magnetococcales bacterium]|nr:bifunctional folylpolyglutamate synthase/dihydrofolate synthase [Magnetococcales bacterium]